MRDKMDSVRERLKENKRIRKMVLVIFLVIVAMVLLWSKGVSPIKAIDKQLEEYIPAYADFAKERDKLNIKHLEIDFYEKDYSSDVGPIVSSRGIFEMTGNYSKYESYKPNIKIKLNDKNKVKSAYAFYSTTDNQDALIKEKTKLEKNPNNEFVLDMNYSHGYDDNEGFKQLYLVFVGELKDKEAYYCEMDNQSVKESKKLDYKIISENELEKITSGQQGTDLSLSLNKPEILDHISQMKNQIE